MNYEEFYNMFSTGGSNLVSGKDAKQNGEFNVDKYSLESLVLSDELSNFFISMEADEDNPFADIGDGGDEEPFADDSGDQSDDNPFAGIGDDSGGFNFDDMGDDSGDFFGDGDDKKQNKEKALKLDRAKAIKEDFDISRQIRADFPERFLAMKDIINTNITIVERTTAPNSDFAPVLGGIIDEYQKLSELISAYIEVMPKKPYDDIFATYVSFWSTMMRIKNLYIKITGTEEEDKENMSKLAII